MILQEMEFDVFDITECAEEIGGKQPSKRGRKPKHLVMAEQLKIGGMAKEKKRRMREANEAGGGGTSREEVKAQLAKAYNNWMRKRKKGNRTAAQAFSPLVCSLSFIVFLMRMRRF